MKFFNPEEYQSKASHIFALLKEKIAEVLPTARVEHIGSSAIEGVISKGDLDIFGGVTNAEFDHACEILASLGFMVKSDTLRTAALCMMECFDYEIDVGIQIVDMTLDQANFIGFRDALRSNPELVLRYNQLKRNSVGLAESDYRTRKSKFITSVISLSIDCYQDNQRG